MAIYRGPGGSGDATADQASTAQLAQTFASQAAASASSASTSAANAATSASEAAASASAVEDSATAAAASASSAATSATNAANSATNATTAETNASESASDAAASEAAAEGFKDDAEAAKLAAEAAQAAAETAQANAETAETGALAAQSAAESARDSALAAYDNFDDRYLGAKSSDPSLDNDGDALVAGALYFNTTDQVMKLYTGSSWVAAYVSGSGFLSASNNLSDLTNAATARQNLDLEIGVDVQAYSSVLQGTTASFTTADETKLDGIEAGADVTDATNVAAAGAIMDGDFSTNGLMKRTGSGTYSVVTDNSSNWDTAYGWGDHAAQNYLDSSDIGSNVQAYDSNLTSFVSAFTLPTTDGSNGQVLTTNGSGTLSFTTASSGGFSGSTIHSPSATSLTLTSSSTQINVVQFTNADNHVVTLPNATTLSEGFPVYRIINHSTIGQAVEVRDSAGALIQAVPANEYADIALTDNSTAAGTWHTSDKSYLVYGSRGSYTTSLAGMFYPAILRMTDTSYIYFTPYWDGANNHNSYIRAVPVTLNSDRSFTYGTEVTSPLFRAYGAFSTAVPTETIIQPVRLSDTSFVVVVGGWRGTNVSTTYYWGSHLSAIAGTLSSGTITFGTWDSLLAVANASGTSTVYNNWLASNQGVSQNGAVQRISDTTFLLVYNNAFSGGTLATSGLTGSLAAYVGTVSGTTISYGSPVTLASTTYTYTRALFNIDTDKFVCLYQQYTNGGTTVTANYKAVVITLSGTTPTWDTPIILEPSGTRDMTGTKYGVVQSGVGKYGNFIFPSTDKIMFSCPYYDSAVGYYFNRRVIASISGTTLTRINEQDVWAYSLVGAVTDNIYLTNDNSVLVRYPYWITFAITRTLEAVSELPLQEWKFNPDTNLFYRVKPVEPTLKRVIQKPSLLKSNDLNYLKDSTEYYFPLPYYDTGTHWNPSTRRFVQSGYYSSSQLSTGYRGQLSLIEVSK